MIARWIASSLIALLIAGAPVQASTSDAANAADAGDTIRWSDLAPAVQERLIARGVTSSTLPAYLADERRATARRLAEGSFDHLVYYALQSTRLSSDPVIEPALSARTYVDELNAARIPVDAAARLDALARALTASATRTAQRIDPARRALFQRILRDAAIPRGSIIPLRRRLNAEYARAMRFLYEKEFVATRGTDRRDATATLYHTRAHSTDTQIEAGFAVAEALATLKALAPTTRIARLLIVGPGLDIAPRTGLLEDAPPQSYQPFAIADTLLALGLADRSTLRIDIADINPLVVQHFTQLATTPSTASVPLVIESGLPDDERMRLSDDFRRYVREWGDAIRVSPRTMDRRDVDRASTAANDDRAIARGAPAQATSAADTRARTRIVSVDPAIAHAISARRLNIVTDTLAPAHDGAPRVKGSAPANAATHANDATRANGARGGAVDRGHDLIVITNVLPYLDDRALLLALNNLAAALAPGGALIHNEPRRLLLETTAALDVPAVQSRTVRLASPVGAEPLFDTAVLHLKARATATDR